MANASRYAHLDLCRSPYRHCDSQRPYSKTWHVYMRNSHGQYAPGPAIISDVCAHPLDSGIYELQGRP